MKLSRLLFSFNSLLKAVALVLPFPKQSRQILHLPHSLFLVRVIEMPDKPRLHNLPVDLQDLLSPAELRAFLLTKFSHHLENLTIDFRDFFSDVFLDGTANVIKILIDYNRTPDEAKSHTAALFYTHKA